MLKKRLVLKKQFLQTYLFKKNFHFHFKLEFVNSKTLFIKKDYHGLSLDSIGRVSEINLC